MSQIPNVLELQQMNDAQQQEMFNNIFLVVNHLSGGDFDNAVNSVFYLSSKSWFINLLKDNIFKDPNFKQGTYFDFIFLTKTHVNNKEDFLYFFSNFPNFDFFKNNVLKFQYSEHEKNIIIESFYHKNFFFIRTDVPEEELENKQFFVSVFENVCVIPRLLQKDIHDSDTNHMIEKFNFLIKYFSFIEKIEHKFTVIFICFFNVYIKKETINPLFHDLYFKFCELFFNDIQYILEHCLNDDSKKSKLIKDITTPIVEKIILRTQINGF